MFEGAQGAMLDVDVGTYPFVTSSNTTAGGAATGTGLGPGAFDHVLGIVKAYTTRVEPAVSDRAVRRIRRAPVARRARIRFGYGRRRRCGWFDAVALRRSIVQLERPRPCVTKLDVLDGLDTIRVCGGYRSMACSSRAAAALPMQFGNCEAVYEEMPGWKRAPSGRRGTRPCPRTHAAISSASRRCSMPRWTSFRPVRSATRTVRQAPFFTTAPRTGRPEPGWCLYAGRPSVMWGPPTSLLAERPWLLADGAMGSNKYCYCKSADAPEL